MKRYRYITKFQPKRVVHENHRKPVSRRDFLAMGIGGAAGYVLMPSVLDIMQNRLLAAEGCSVASSGNSTPVLILDCPGGTPLGRSVIVRDQGGNYLSNYSKWGLSPSIAPQATGFTPNTDYGLPMFPTGGFLLGLNSVITNPAIKASTGMYAVYCNANDDTNNNLFSPLQGFAMHGGLTGSLKSSVGASNGDSGAN